MGEWSLEARPLFVFVFKSVHSESRIGRGESHSQILAPLIRYVGVERITRTTEPIHNRVAEEFLSPFFTALAKYEDVHASLLAASKYLKSENILDPITISILKSKIEPTNIPDICLFICNELAKGRVDDRNDLTHQRIRSSEVFVQQIHNLMLGSYNEYRFKRL